jgi:two-component system cell cycle sensor histidine kinase/response regulator CckA
VSDQGVGMEEATRQRALEPFFTTKPDGEGTGIGLATADAIVREHGGRVELASAPGEGTTVTVLLPAAASDGATAVRAPVADGVAHVENAPVVLLAEDEAAVRTLARRALQRAGFAVAEARHGADALRLVESGVQPRLVVTDVAMPELSGVALAERLRARDPSLPILFISGYTAGESIPSVRSPSGRTAFLQKPFSADALVRAAIGLMNGDGVGAPSPGTEYGDGVGAPSPGTEQWDGVTTRSKGPEY